MYIGGFIISFKGETVDEACICLISLSEEDRYTAAMVESYRLASSPLLLDILRTVLAQYYVVRFTTGNLRGANEFLKKSEIQGLVAGESIA